MATRHEQLKELFDLFEAAREQRLTDEQFRRLEELIANDEVSCLMYVKYMQLCSDLRYFEYLDEGNKSSFAGLQSSDADDFYSALQALAIEEKNAAACEDMLVKTGEPHETVDACIVKSDGKREYAKWPIVTFAVSAAAMLMLAVMILFFPGDAEIVAYLGDSDEAAWESAAPERYNMDAMREGDYVLYAGLAEIEFVNGVDVIVEAPARFSLLSDSRMELFSGRIFANVKGGISEFVVETPDGLVVDRGTEFGVEVSPITGRTETHVYKGRVDLFADNKATSSKMLSLSGGQAGRISQGRLQKVPMQRGAFKTFVPTPYERYARSLKPAVYWRFQPGSAQSLINLIEKTKLSIRYKGTVDLIHGPFGSDSAESAAAKLHGDESFISVPAAGVRLRAAGSLKNASYSYSMWLRADEIDSQLVLSSTNRAKLRYRLITIDSDGKLAYVWYNAAKGLELDSIRSKKPLAPTTWYHVVITVDGKGYGQLYINGILQSELRQPGEEYFAAKFYGNWHLGFNPGLSDRLTDLQSFNGAISEISEFDRILSPVEIKKLYQAGIKSVEKF